MSKIEFLTQIIIKMKEKNYPSNFCVLMNLNAFCINCAIGRKTTCHGEESFKRRDYLLVMYFFFHFLWRGPCSELRRPPGPLQASPSLADALAA